MDPAITLLTLAVAVLELSIAGYYSGKAIEHSQYGLLQEPKKQLPARPSIDELIWSRTASPLAQYDYLLGHVFASVGFACLSVLAIAQGPLLGGLLFIGLTLACSADSWLCWKKFCGSGER